MDYKCILIFVLFPPPVPFGLQRMKRSHASSSKIGETTGGGSAKKAFKSQNQQGPSSKKKGTDGEGIKAAQKRNVIIIFITHIYIYIKTS